MLMGSSGLPVRIWWLWTTTSRMRAERDWGVKSDRENKQHRASRDLFPQRVEELVSELQITKAPQPSDQTGSWRMDKWMVVVVVDSRSRSDTPTWPQFSHKSGRYTCILRQRYWHNNTPTITSKHIFYLNNISLIKNTNDYCLTLRWPWSVNHNGKSRNKTRDRKTQWQITKCNSNSNSQEVATWNRQTKQQE